MDINLLSNIGIASIVAYLLGSIPFGQLASRWKKIDIFQTGSQLSGAANVFQKTGHKLGIFVFLGDATKGVFAIIAGFITDNSLDYNFKESFEKKYLTSQLKKFSGNISKTAKFIGMERSALHRKLKLLGVKDLN